MHINRVTSNLKGGVEADLGEKTLIIGPNGRGKSAILNAVELACGASASDIVGRTLIKRELDLLPLGLDGVLEATAQFSTGESANFRTVSNGKGGAKRADFDCSVPVSFPVRDVRSALGGNADTVRSWLLGCAAGQVSRGDITAWFSSEDAELYAHLAGSVRTSKDEISVLLATLETAGKSMRAKKRQLQSDQSLLDRMGQSLEAEPTESDLTALEEKVGEALEVVNRAQASTFEEGGTLASLKARASRLIDKLGEVQGEVDSLAQAAPTKPPGEELQRANALRVLSQGNQVHIDLGVPDCLVCQRPGPLDHAALLASKDKIFSETNTWRMWREDMDAAEQDLLAAQRLAAGAVKTFQEEQAIRERETDSYVGPSPADAWSVYQEVERACTQAQSTKYQWGALRGQQDGIRQLRREIGALEALLASGKQAVNRLLKTAVDRFTEKVQGYLPPSDAFALVLEEDGKEVCRLGFERDGRLHTALSGAEWARLTLAVACAASENCKGLRVFTPEERAFDPATLREVMAALTEAPGQVIITSPIKHKGRTPKGWTIIDLGSG